MVTIEVPDDVLASAVRAARAASPQAAVVQALREFADRHGPVDPTVRSPGFGAAVTSTTVVSPSDGPISPEAAAAVRAAEEFARTNGHSMRIPLPGTSDAPWPPSKANELLALIDRNATADTFMSLEELMAMRMLDMPTDDDGYPAEE